jgi:hypothetical protein
VARTGEGDAADAFLLYRWNLASTILFSLVRTCFSAEANCFLCRPRKTSIGRFLAGNHTRTLKIAMQQRRSPGGLSLRSPRAFTVCSPSSSLAGLSSSPPAPSTPRSSERMTRQHSIRGAPASSVQPASGSPRALFSSPAGRAPQASSTSGTPARITASSPTGLRRSVCPNATATNSPTTLPCPHCSVITVRSHQATCPKRIVRCEGCEEPVSAASISAHRALCNGVAIACPGCAASLTRRLLQSHVTLNCPASQWPCAECGEVFQDSTAFVKHAVPSCVRRVVPCQLCAAPIPFSALATHLVQCAEAQLRRTPGVANSRRPALPNSAASRPKASLQPEHVTQGVPPHRERIRDRSVSNSDRVSEGSGGALAPWQDSPPERHRDRNKSTPQDHDNRCTHDDHQSETALLRSSSRDRRATVSLLATSPQRLRNDGPRRVQSRSPSSGVRSQAPLTRSSSAPGPGGRRKPHASQAESASVSHAPTVRPGEEKAQKDPGLELIQPQPQPPPPLLSGSNEYPSIDLTQPSAPASPTSRRCGTTPRAPLEADESTMIPVIPASSGATHTPSHRDPAGHSIPALAPVVGITTVRTNQAALLRRSATSPLARSGTSSLNVSRSPSHTTSAAGSARTARSAAHINLPTRWAELVGRPAPPDGDDIIELASGRRVRDMPAAEQVRLRGEWRRAHLSGGLRRRVVQERLSQVAENRTGRDLVHQLIFTPADRDVVRRA